jgi:CrcB protein
MRGLETYLLVALGSALGGCLRYALSTLIAARHQSALPWGTLVINVSGSLVLGFFLAVALGRLALDPRLRLLVAVGFCGGYTTFSTFAWETATLLELRRTWLAAAYAAASALASVVAVLLGAALGRRL